MQADRLFFGCVADDFTGAGDAASFLVKSGISTALYNGIPEKKMEDKSVQGVVIALKIRNVKKEHAVKESLEAFEWLKEQGACIFYFKYCSTFDSTDEGNIGPVIDAVMSFTTGKRTYTLRRKTLCEWSTFRRKPYEESPADAHEKIKAGRFNETSGKI